MRTFSLIPLLIASAALLRAPAPLQAQDAAATVTDTVVTESDTVTWTKPRFEERAKDRSRLVAEGIAAEGITDEAVLEAMRSVPRHLFMPEEQRPLAYRNSALPIGHGQTISQPYIVGFMTQILELRETDRVLEIGTGSGYQAAVLSEITPFVYTIEIIPELGRQARRRLQDLGYETIRVRIGDGYQGWQEHAPFDRIILTAAAPEIPQPLIEQLAPGGILVMPLGEENAIQTLVKITKTGSGEIREKSIIPVRFVPMTGEIQKH